MVDNKIILIFDSLNRKDMYKKKQVIILKGTNEAKVNEIIMNINGYLIANCDPIKINPYYIYVLSDEPIKEGDWCIWNNHPRKIIEDCGTLGFISKGETTFIFLDERKDDCKKIIATNNPELNKGWVRNNDPLKLNPEYVDITTMNGVPNIPLGFIQRYIVDQNGHFPKSEYMVEYGYTIDKSLGHFHQQRKYFLKVNEENTINIKEEQRTWDRNQVIEIARQAFNQGEMNEGDVLESYMSFDDLIDELI